MRLATISVSPGPSKNRKDKTKEKRMRTVTLVLALAVSAVVLTAALPMADAVEQVILLDECDPVTFNLALGPGTCVNVGGKVTFTTPRSPRDTPRGFSLRLSSPSKKETRSELPVRVARSISSLRSRISGTDLFRR